LEHAAIEAPLANGLQDRLLVVTEGVQFSHSHFARIAADLFAAFDLKPRLATIGHFRVPSQKIPVLAGDNFWEALRPVGWDQGVTTYRPAQAA
jgi:hypothetical protein